MSFWKTVSKHPVLTSLTLLYGANWLYCYLTHGVFKSRANLLGKTVIITGCSSGIGKAAAMELARRGARVIMACRNREKANIVRDEIIAATNNYNVVVKVVDVSLMSSVREFTEDFLKTESRLDVLIHNAGVLMSTKRKTVEGINEFWATNHFGSFLMTLLLIDIMKKTEHSRIILVSSVTHRLGKIVPDHNKQLEEKRPFQVYCATKLANVLFSKELSRRLKSTEVTANCLHPGAIYTPIWNTSPLWVIILVNIFKPFFKSEKEGSETIVYLAVSDDVRGVSGQYFSDCKVQTAAKRALDKNVANKLWKISEDIVQLRPTDPHLEGDPANFAAHPTSAKSSL